MRARFLALLLVIGGSVLAGSLVARADTPMSWADRALLEPDNEEAQRRVRGAVFDGLRRPADGRGPCANTFAVEDQAAGSDALCTHGPDPSPPGIDVQAAAPLATTTELATGQSVPCEGDGTSGSRVQAIYAVATDRPDRFSEVLPSIRHWAADVDRTISDSATAHGGVRHARWVTDDRCELDVLRVVVPARGDDTFSATVASLKAAGHVRADRKYLVWMDANVYCGIATVLLDDSPAANNRNNGSKAMFGRVDAGCWGLNTPVEAHELVHTLGAVQLSAPHSTGAGHCTDENDLLCYRDAPGVELTVICDQTWERLLDCNGDDYFAIDPPAGSYLASHWNTAESAFLSDTPDTRPDGFSTVTTPPSTTSTAVPTTTTTAPIEPPVVLPTTTTTTTAPVQPPVVPPTTTSAPPTTTTSTSTTVAPPVEEPTEAVVLDGRLSNRNRSDVHAVTIDQAANYRIELVPSANNRREAQWRLIVLDTRGRLVDIVRGSSSLTIDGDLAVGRHRIVVLGGKGGYTVTIAER